MTATTELTITVKVAGRQYVISHEALIGISAPLARAYRILPLGEHGGQFVALIDDYAPDVSREFIAMLAIQPLLIIPVSRDELDAAISSVFGEGDKPTRPLTTLAEI